MSEISHPRTHARRQAPKRNGVCRNALVRLLLITCRSEYGITAAVGLFCGGFGGGEEGLRADRSRDPA
ncbi:hypothetical protein MRX96_012160 [Rhipicephalus microplus]